MGDDIGELREAELKEAFSLFDKDNESCITPAKLGDVMRMLDSGLNPTEEELRELIVDIDTSGDSKLSYNDFKKFMTDRELTGSVEEEINEAFKIFDMGKSGQISGDNLREIMSRLGENLTDHEVQTMLQQWSSENNGEISESDFKRLMTSSED